MSKIEEIKETINEWLSDLYDKVDLGNKETILQAGEILRELYTLQPKLTEDEKVILRNLPSQYKWITRSERGTITLHCGKPIKGSYYDTTVHWKSFFGSYSNFYNHLFQFIKWEDEEPYNIQELLKES